MQKNAVAHIDWCTTQLVQLKDFMSGLFGWEFQPFGEGFFSYNPPDGGVSIGVLHNERAQIGGGTPNVYIDVVSIDACFERAAALGGGIAVPKTPVPGMGSFGFVHAPDGNLIGLFETDQ